MNIYENNYKLLIIKYLRIYYLTFII